MVKISRLFTYPAASLKFFSERPPVGKKQRAATLGYGPFWDQDAQRDYFAPFLS